MLGCNWLQVYDIVEDLYAQLLFHDEELADWESETPRAYLLQQMMNDYFLHAGIGWKMVNGKIIYRGDEPFEQTVQTDSEALLPVRPTAARRLQNAMESLSKRPHPDTAGAVSDAVSAIECVLSDIEGAQAGAKCSLGDYIGRQDLFPGSLKAAVGGFW